MNMFKHFYMTVVYLLTFYIPNIYNQDAFEHAFKDCHTKDSEFDICIKNALNTVRPYFKTGVPEWNIPPFDPFFAHEVVQNRGLPLLSYKLKLLNVTESGWTVSEVIKFKSDLKDNQIRYTQFFPAKYLKGKYTFSGNIFGINLSVSGYWNLGLFDFVQTSTITWELISANNIRINVKIDVERTRNMELHITNLLGGFIKLEYILDKIINFAWPPGFEILKPIINDLVGTAFTDIFNNAFHDFQFNRLIN